MVSVDARLMAQIDDDLASAEVEEEASRSRAAVVEDSADAARRGRWRGQTGGKSPPPPPSPPSRWQEMAMPKAENGKRADAGDRSGDEGEAARRPSRSALADVAETEGPVAEDEGKPRRRRPLAPPQDRMMPRRGRGRG